MVHPYGLTGGFQSYGGDSSGLVSVSLASQTCFSCLCQSISRRQLKTSLESWTVSTDGDVDKSMGKLQSVISMREEIRRQEEETNTCFQKRSDSFANSITVISFISICCCILIWVYRSVYIIKSQISSLQVKLRHIKIESIYPKNLKSTSKTVLSNCLY